MDNKTKLRIGGLALLTTAVLSLIIVLIVDSWPLAILLAVIIVAAAAGGFVWTSRRQQRQFLERLKKFDIDPEKGRINEANLRRMYHSGGQHQKDAITLVCLSQKCSVDEAHAIFKKTSDPSGNEPNGCPTGTRSKTSTSLIPTVTGRLNIPPRFRRPVFISIKPISVSIAL